MDAYVVGDFLVLHSNDGGFDAGSRFARIHSDGDAVGKSQLRATRHRPDSVALSLKAFAVLYQGRVRIKGSLAVSK